MPSLTSFIRAQDYFGAPVSLGFNKKGSSHKTVVGGWASILVRLIMATYTLDLVNKWWNFLEDRNTTFESTVESVELNANISLAESQVRFAMLLVNPRTGITFDFDSPELKKHVRMTSFTEKWNWRNVPATLERNYVPMKKCNLTDYSNDPVIQALFEGYHKTGYQNFCPEDTKQLIMNNVTTSYSGSRVVIQIEKCIPNK